MKTPLPLAEEARSGLDPLDREVVGNFLQEYRSAIEGAEILILIPAYNEEDSVASLAQVLPDSIYGLKAVPIVLVDGATDATAKLAREQGLAVCEAPINRGQGAALKMGYKIAVLAQVSIVAIVDADGQWNPHDLESIVEPLVEDLADFVQGSRVLGSTQVGDPVRDLGVTVFAKVISVLISKKVTDTSSGIRALRSELFERIRLQEPQYQSSELLISAAFAGARLCEIPVTMSKRSGGSSKKGNNIRYGANYAKVVLRTWVRERFVLAR